MADDVPMEGLEDEGWEAVEVEEDADPATLSAELFLDSFGFELFEVENQSPHIDYAGDFASYMAEEALFAIFGLDADFETVSDEVTGEVEAQCAGFVEEILEPALEALGGWEWFDSCTVSCSYDITDGSMAFSLDDIERADAEHPADAATKFAPVAKKEALEMEGETDVEVTRDMVQVEADMDEGNGDLAEWIYDALISGLRIADRGAVDNKALDQIADKAADLCGQDVSKFDTLRFHVDDDGRIAGFDFNGSHYALDL